MNINTSIRAKYYGGQNNAIEFIVVHYTANGGTSATAKGNANFFANCPTQVSAHYVVDEGDVIYQCVPDCNAAWSVGGNKYPATKGAKWYGICTNYNSLNIEMVSHTDVAGAYYIPQKTINNTIELVKSLQAKYGVDNAHVIRHYDVNGKPCPWCWTNVDPYYGESLWEDFLLRLEENKNEPKTGDTFQVRILVDLNIREDAGTEYPVINTIYDRYRYTIIETKKAADGGTWGHLKAGGWINISPKFVQRV